MRRRDEGRFVSHFLQLNDITRDYYDSLRTFSLSSKILSKTLSPFLWSR